MKLKTLLREDSAQGRAYADYIDGSEVDHDAIAAHALMRALRECVGPSSIERRADELMREWGYRSQG